MEFKRKFINEDNPKITCEFDYRVDLNFVPENLKKKYEKMEFYTTDKEKVQELINQYPNEAAKYVYHKFIGQSRDYEHIGMNLYTSYFLYSGLRKKMKPEEKIEKLFSKPELKEEFSEEINKKLLKNVTVSSTGKDVLFKQVDTIWFIQGQNAWIPIDPFSKGEISPYADISENCPEVLGVWFNGNMTLNEDFEDEYFEALSEANKYFYEFGEYRYLFKEELKKEYNKYKYDNTYRMDKMNLFETFSIESVLSFCKTKCIIIPFATCHDIDIKNHYPYGEAYMVFKYSEENMAKLLKVWENQTYHKKKNFSKEEYGNYLYRVDRWHDLRKVFKYEFGRD